MEDYICPKCGKLLWQRHTTRKIDYVGDKAKLVCREECLPRKE